MRRPAFIARQAARPTGLLGRLLARVMARETAAFNREVLAAVDARPGERILEVGFGHGRTLATAAALHPDSAFAGIDVSPDAALVATAACRRLLAEGRVELAVGDGAALPWPDGTFAAALSVHTLYFWPEPAHNLRELARVLVPGGRLVLGFRRHTAAAERTFPPPTYRFHSEEEVSALLVAAGFEDVAISPGTSDPHDLRLARARRGGAAAAA